MIDGIENQRRRKRPDERGYDRGAGGQAHRAEKYPCEKSIQENVRAKENLHCNGRRKYEEENVPEWIENLWLYDRQKRQSTILVRVPKRYVTGSQNHAAVNELGIELGINVAVNEWAWDNKSVQYIYFPEKYCCKQ